MENDSELHAIKDISDENLDFSINIIENDEEKKKPISEEKIKLISEDKSSKIKTGIDVKENNTIKENKNESPKIKVEIKSTSDDSTQTRNTYNEEYSSEEEEFYVDYLLKKRNRK